MSPFEALFGYKPPLLPAIHETTNVAAMDNHLQQRQEILRQLKRDLAMTQNIMKQKADKGRRERIYSGGRGLSETKAISHQGLDYRSGIQVKP